MSQRTPQPPEALLELRDISKEYKRDVFQKKEVAVKDLSCRFLKGHCTGLLGHNGAGKTTTIRMIFGLIKPDRGEVLFDGTAIATKHKRRIGYMPENNKLPTSLTPAEILRYQLRIFKPEFLKSVKAKNAIETSLRIVDLWEQRNKRVSKLSKGMARRLSWAQATIHEPELVILDEPASGLDPLGYQQMTGWIRDLKKRGTTILLCTHELSAVRDLCDHFHIIKRGQLAYSTLDPAPTQVPLLGTSSYELHVSGADERALTALQQKRHLPAWQNFNQAGFLSMITFASYPEASVWTQAALESGLIIVKFDHQKPKGNDDLLPFFDGRTP